MRLFKHSSSPTMVEISAACRDKYVQEAAEYLKTHPEWPNGKPYVIYTGDMMIVAERSCIGSISVYNCRILTSGHTFNDNNKDYLKDTYAA